jgi:hypothetical protein
VAIKKALTDFKTTLEGAKSELKKAFGEAAAPAE